MATAVATLASTLSMRRTWRTIVFAVVYLAGASASFTLEGTRTSYAQFQKWYPTKNGSIEFEFRTAVPDGVLLYTDDGGYYDFVEIKLVSGSVRLR